MKIGLSCSDSIKNILLELLGARNITVRQDARVYIVETGYEIPKEKITILFDVANIGHLIELLDEMAFTREETLVSVVGRTESEAYEVIQLKQVYYFEARGNNVFAVTMGREFRVKERLYELEGKLPKNRFIRVGKSHIVNMHNVKEIIPWFGRRLILRFANSKQEVEVSKVYVKSVKEFLGM